VLELRRRLFLSALQLHRNPVEALRYGGSGLVRFCVANAVATHREREEDCHGRYREN
jgi:hypothetical protein